MSLSKEQTEAVIKKFGKSETDTGSTSVQIALLTKRIEELQSHFKEHKKDNHSRTGLMRLINQRRSLLAYLKKSNKENEIFKNEKSNIKTN